MWYRLRILTRPSHMFAADVNSHFRQRPAGRAHVQVLGPPSRWLRGVYSSGGSSRGNGSPAAARVCGKHMAPTLNRDEHSWRSTRATTPAAARETSRESACPRTSISEASPPASSAEARHGHDTS